MPLVDPRSSTWSLLSAATVEARVSARHGRMRQDDATFTGIPPDHHALLALLQAFDFQVEAELTATRISTPETQRPTHGQDRSGECRFAVVRAHAKDLDRPADMLCTLLPPIDIGVVADKIRHVADRARNRDASRFGHCLDALGEVHPIAEYIVAFLIDNDFTEMHPDAE